MQLISELMIDLVGLLEVSQSYLKATMGRRQLLVQLHNKGLVLRTVAERHVNKGRV